ncbi:MAG: hypothetical protein WBM02_03550 [bacterium]
MKKDESCERLLELVNGLIDGDLDRNDLIEAESMIQNDPECRAVYHTLRKTIALYQARKKETDSAVAPEINWQVISKKIEEITGRKKTDKPTIS